MDRLSFEPAVIEPPAQSTTAAAANAPSRLPVVRDHASRKWFSLAFGAALLAAIFLAGRLRIEHFVLIPAFASLPWIGPRAARLWSTLMPFVLVGVVYDLFILVLPYRGAIHVADLYGWEKALFSIQVAGKSFILPELFATYTNPVLDFFCGFAYATYLFEMVIVGVVLHFRAPALALKLGLGFLGINLLGMLIWATFPAAPPWYVAQYGLGPARLDAIASAAGAARFDELLGITFFKNFYARNVNVFGAMPSLHVACPTVVALTVRPLGKRWFVPTLAFALLVAFAAIYLSHHYVLDVLAGALLGILVVVALNRIFARAEPISEEAPRADA